MRLGVTIRFTRLGCLKTAFGSLLDTNDPGQLQRFCKGVGMSGDTRFSMKFLRQFGLAGIWLCMSESGQQRVMLRRDYKANSVCA